MGIDQETLTSGNAILPVAYYLFKREKGDLSSSSSDDVKNTLLIQRWLVGSLLNGVFGGNSDTTLGTARSIIKDSLRSHSSFPYRELVDGLAQKGRLTEFNEHNMGSYFEIRYGKRVCFLALSLLYDTTTWGITSYHIDHIIPRSLADRKSLMAANVSESLIQRIENAVNRLGNLQLLQGYENLEKNNKPFSEWIKTRDRDFLKRHCIPDREDLYSVMALENFVTEREKLIEQRLRQSVLAQL